MNAFPRNTEHCGSSPRVRGKLEIQREHAQQQRIIPASAGQTGTFSYRGRLLSDHPRECGANGRPPQEIVGAVGSSPRVRGKHTAKLCYQHGERIIPASAGQTSPRWLAPSFRTDHPRECGANHHCAS